MNLREQVLSYGTAHHLVVSYARWIEAAISDWFNPDQDAVPAEVFETIRERALAIMGFLDGIAFDGQQKCSAYLKEAAAFLAAEGNSSDDSTPISLKDFLERFCSWEGICRPDEVRELAGSWKDKLQKAAKRGHFTLPTIEATGPRNTQLYLSTELADCWPQFCEYYKDLPALKDHQ